MIFIKNQPVLTKEKVIIHRNIHQIKPRGSRHTHLSARYKGKLRQVEVRRHDSKKVFAIL